MAWPQDPKLNSYFGRTSHVPRADRQTSLASPVAHGPVRTRSSLPVFDLPVPERITPLLDPMQSSASRSTSSTGQGHEPRRSVLDSKAGSLTAGPGSASSPVVLHTASSGTFSGNYFLLSATQATGHHETVQSLMNSTDGLQSDQVHADPVVRKSDAQRKPDADESKRSTGRSISSIRSGTIDRPQRTAQRFEAVRKAIHAEREGGPSIKDQKLTVYYVNHSIKLYRSVVAAEFAALNEDCVEELEMPRAQLLLLEYRPDLLTPAVYTRVYARLLNGMDVGPDLTTAIGRLTALNRAYPSDSKMLGAMRDASHASGLMTAEVSAKWVRQLFSAHPGLVTADLLHAELTALRADRMSEPAWMDDAVKLFELFPDKVASIDGAILSTRIQAEPRFSDAVKRALHDRIEAARAAYDSPVK